MESVRQRETAGDGHCSALHVSRSEARVAVGGNESTAAISAVLLSRRASKGDFFT